MFQLYVSHRNNLLSIHLTNRKPIFNLHNPIIRIIFVHVLDNQPFQLLFIPCPLKYPSGQEVFVIHSKHLDHSTTNSCCSSCDSFCASSTSSKSASTISMFSTSVSTSSGFLVASIYAFCISTDRIPHLLNLFRSTVFFAIAS